MFRSLRRCISRERPMLPVRFSVLTRQQVEQLFRRQVCQ